MLKAWQQCLVEVDVSPANTRMHCSSRVWEEIKARMTLSRSEDERNDLFLVKCLWLDKSTTATPEHQKTTRVKRTPGFFKKPTFLQKTHGLILTGLEPDVVIMFISDLESVR